MSSKANLFPYRKLSKKFNIWPNLINFSGKHHEGMEPIQRKSGSFLPFWIMHPSLKIMFKSIYQSIYLGLTDFFCADTAAVQDLATLIYNMIMRLCPNNPNYPISITCLNSVCNHLILFHLKIRIKITSLYNHSLLNIVYFFGNMLLWLKIKSF